MPSNAMIGVTTYHVLSDQASMVYRANVGEMSFRIMGVMLPHCTRFQISPA